MVSADKLACLYEKLLVKDSTKDLEIEMSDGVLRAHSAILVAGSAAIEGMLKHGLAAMESQQRLTWKEHTMEVGNFFLRLLYVGTVDEAEWCKAWGTEPCQEAPSILEIKTPNGQTKFAGRYKLLPERANGKPLWKKDDVKCSHWLFYCSGRWFVSNSQSKDKGFTEGKGWITSKLCDLMPDVATGWQRYDDALSSFVDDCDLSIGEPQPRVPLRLLLGSMEIAKMYMFEDLLEVLVEAVQGRVAFDTFDAILRAAIKIDSMPLRVYCTQYAIGAKHGVRELYLSNVLSPQVKAELAGTWGPSKPSAKRRKL